MTPQAHRINCSYACYLLSQHLYTLACLQMVALSGINTAAVTAAVTASQHVALTVRRDANDLLSTQAVVVAALLDAHALLTAAKTEVSSQSNDIVTTKSKRKALKQQLNLLLKRLDYLLAWSCTIVGTSAIHSEHQEVLAELARFQLQTQQQ
jgi:hypothetical protein